MKSREQVVASLLTGVWLILAAAGLMVMADYDCRPGVPTSPPIHWPSGASLARISGQSTLIMFLHPHCPCSRASLHELSRLALSHQGQLVYCVVFVQSAEMPDGWSQTDLWERAVANQQFRVVLDRDGSLAGSFAAKTSGQVLIYDNRGALKFNGGITPGRGHVGDSSGRAIVAAIIEGRGSGAVKCSAAFGCALTLN